MLRLRPYKPGDAGTILSWCREEVAFRKWTGSRYGAFPITAEDMNRKYFENNGDCAEPDNFYPMTAFDEAGIVGHLIMRFTDAEKSVLRFGFVIVDDARRGRGYGKELIALSLKYAFEILKVNKVTLGVFDNNPSACGCYRSAGFQEAEAGAAELEMMGETWKISELELTKEDYFSKASF